MDKKVKPHHAGGAASVWGICNNSVLMYEAKTSEERLYSVTLFFEQETRFSEAELQFVHISNNNI